MLTNATVKAARPGARPYKLADAGGLYLFVRPSGSKCFRMKFRFRGKERLLTFGNSPDLSLADARTRRDQVRENLRRGVDPSIRSGELTSANDNSSTFEALARRWHDRRRDRWSAEHATDVIASLERDVFPAIGAVELTTIEPAAVLELLLAIEERGCVESARRIRERISGVFRMGISMKLCTADPAALIADELSPRPLQRPQPALLDLDGAKGLLAAADAAKGAAIVKLASRLLALTAVRLAALRGARWAEFEGIDWADAPGGADYASIGGEYASEPCKFALWRIPPARMKLTKVKKGDAASEHVVPLSRQAVAVLVELRALSGAGDLVFPGRRKGRPIGEGAIGDLYVRAAFAGRHVPHGWRATFSTILNDRFPDDQALIDRALAHAGHKGKVEAAYNRAQHQSRMRRLFQDWADLIDPI